MSLTFRKLPHPRRPEPDAASRREPERLVRVARQLDVHPRSITGERKFEASNRPYGRAVRELRGPGAVRRFLRNVELVRARVSRSSRCMRQRQSIHVAQKLDDERTGGMV